MDYLIQFCNISTIAVCIICKIPQILAVVKSKSVEGVSSTSVMIELLGYSIVLGYNLVMEYPFSAFLEYVFLVVEDIVLILVLFYYVGTLDIVKIGGVGAFVALFYGFTIGIPHPNVLPMLIQIATPISASSKLIQLKEIWSTKNSDSVSVLTWLIAAYTCITRIVTTLVSTGDVPLLINYAVALTLNTLVIISALRFRSNPTKTSSTTTPDGGPSPSKSTKVGTSTPSKNTPTTSTNSPKAAKKDE